MKVDVLAVMDRAADQLGQAGHNETANALLAAREAVAVLLDATAQYKAIQGTASTFGEVRDARKQLFAADATLSREGR